MFICCQPKTSYLSAAKRQGQTAADTHRSVFHTTLNSVAFAHEETMASENKGIVNSEFFRAHSHTFVIRGEPQVYRVCKWQSCSALHLNGVLFYKTIQIQKEHVTM